jgi:MYXO-CTERM domain-containing protein
MKMFGWIRGLSVAAMLVLPALAFADPIGPNCGSCDGGIYTLTWSGTPQSTTATTETDRITLTINTAGVPASLTSQGGGAGPFFLNAVAIKIASSVRAATLVAAPGGTGNWTLGTGGINAGGCDGSGSGFECADWTAVGAGAALGGTLVFTFDETIALGSLITSNLGASIKAQYVNAAGSKVGALVSEGITLQTSSSGISSTGSAPEPSSSSLALLAVGLLAAGLGARRKS